MEPRRRRQVGRSRGLGYQLITVVARTAHPVGSGGDGEVAAAAGVGDTVCVRECVRGRVAKAKRVAFP
jgi:hypothetical protein